MRRVPVWDPEVEINPNVLGGFAVVGTFLVLSVQFGTAPTHPCKSADAGHANVRHKMLPNTPVSEATRDRSLDILASSADH
jgi:hypothetical protein